MVRGTPSLAVDCGVVSEGGAPYIHTGGGLAYTGGGGNGEAVGAFADACGLVDGGA